ncbi:TOX high mobility group box family member 3 isoform X2 [Diachasmimorpha longicaudata]
MISCALFLLTAGDDSEEVSPLPPIKIDKHLRRALLKALEDLETESEEQKPDPPTAEGLATKVADNINISNRFAGASFSFSDFPGESSEVPSEEKLQNSSFVEMEKLETSEPKEAEKAAFQKYDVLLGDKEIQEKSPNPNQVDQILTRSVEITGGRSANLISQSTIEKDEKEHLSVSSSNGIVSASANSLVPPSPTPSSPTVKTVSQNITSPLLPTLSPDVSANPNDTEVNIFQAPLVAAFTVQQDERGVPKSVVPLYKPGSDNEGLSLQEQLEFRQQLLDKQLAELQAQQIRQTQFLYNQQQLYHEQLRLKQRQQLHLQEQARIKQFEEQRIQQFNQLQQQVQQAQQAQLQNPQGAFSQNNLLAFQPPFQTQNVQFQPSVSLQLPNTAVPPPFAQSPSVQEQLRLQQLQRQQIIQHQAQQLQFQRQQALYLQQQRLQQSFPGFQSEFQPPAPIPATRFHRQEAFGSVGNFGINDNRQIINRNHLPLEPPRLPAQDFVTLNQFGFRQQPLRPPTAARQIQHLLHQSGVAGGLQSPKNQQGRSNQEDLNIVSKVLALNVGSIPTKNLQFNDQGFARA